MELIVAFAAIGGGIKFIDEAFDEGIFNKRVAYLLAPALVAVWMAVSLFDAISATILFSILAGVLLAGKIDNTIFKTSAISILLAALLSGKISILWTPFLSLTIAGIIDEFGNNYVDSNRARKAVEFFFLHRFTMKIGVTLLCAFSIFSWDYLFAFLAFDMSYDLVGMLGQWTMRSNSTAVIPINKNPAGDAGIGIFTSAVHLCKDVPKGFSAWTFYPTGKKVEFTGLLSSISL